MSSTTWSMYGEPLGCVAGSAGGASDAVVGTPSSVPSASRAGGRAAQRPAEDPLAAVAAHQADAHLPDAAGAVVVHGVAGRLPGLAAGRPRGSRRS